MRTKNSYFVRGAVAAAVAGWTVAAAAGVTIRPGEGWTPLSGETQVREGSALDYSGFGGKRTAAGSLGRVVARESHFEFERAPGVPQRFYGVNFCFTGNFMSADEAEELCTRLERVGYNAIRIHHYEKVLCEGAADGTTINPTRMAELDNLLTAAIRHGLYVTTDLFVSRRVPYRSCGIDRDGVIPMNEFKELVLCHEGVRSNLVVFSKALLGHVNPATGRRWADEPALMSISLVNENNPGNHGFAFLRQTLGVTAEQMPDKRFEELVAEKVAAFDREMIRVLKEEIGYRGLVTGLNGWHNAPCYRDLRRAYDYVDDHFYVDHPKFLEKPWCRPSECRNANPITYGNAGIDWNKEAWVRRSDRPYTITEWNFSCPGRYRGAGGIVFGAGAALQEMDGVWRFAWSHSHDRLMKDGPLSYFDAAVDPLMLATERAIIALYLRGDMPADRQVKKPTDPCRWLTADPTNGTFTIATPRTAGVFAEPSDRTYRMGPLQVSVKGHSAAVWATSLDGRPLAESRHLLVTHVTDVQDAGTVYRAADRKVLEKWGDLPHLMANGTAEIALDTSGTLKVYALGADGTRLGEMKTSGRGLAFTADVARDPKSATYLYEIVEAEPPPLTVTCTRASHLYGVGERAEFEITSPRPGTRVRAKLSRAYLPAIETVVTTTPARVSFGLGEPGFVVCEAQTLRSDGKAVGKSVLAGAGFEPARLETAAPPPADYDAFWTSAFREQEAIPADFTARPLSNGVSLVSCRTVWGTRMYGFLKMPKGKGPVPLQVTVGGGDSFFCEDAAMGAEPIGGKENRALLLIQLPGWEPSVRTWTEAGRRNEQWLKENGIPKGSLIYWNCEKGPRERWYYRCILGACRLIECAAKRPEIDPARVYYYGASTGGGYGVFLAAFSPYIKAAICEVPNYGNMAGPGVGRPSGEDDRGKYWKTSLYYDGAYCAPRITCPVFMSCGYWDQSCCPETVYCIYNALRCRKVMFDKVNNGHGDCPKGYAETRNAWLNETLGLKVGTPQLDCLFRDGFVFSAAHPTRVAGRAVAGSEVTVKALGKTVRAKAGADGRFSAELPALGVRKTPFTVEVTDSSGTTTISDCLSGLVLLAAGQSNMEVPVKEALDPEKEIAAANFPQIREFKVEHDFDFVPQTSCSGKWTAVTPKTAAEIGAIGYYTARRLQKELDGIPVGIVNNSYSATSIQPWLPLGILQGKYPGSLGTYKKFSPLGRDGVIKRREELGKSFLVQDPGNKGEAQGWHLGAAGADWKEVKMPCFLDYEVYGEATDGAFWVVRTFVAPDDFLDKDVEFRATAIDDYDITYVNGVKIGATGEETPDSYDMPRGYRIRKGLLKKGENTVAIRIFDTAHAGGIPPGATLALAYGEKEFSLAGLWKTKAELVIPSKPWPPDYLPLVKIYHTGSVLYNAMFLPVSGVPYDAMLWYQGESNAGQRTYGDMLDDLITRWRTDVGQPDVPFVVMQLASFTARPKSAADTGAWPLTRQHQAEARKLKNVRLVPTIDIGDANRIHPLDKQEVGRRTALVLLQDFWAKDRFRSAVAYPEMTKVVREGSTFVIELKDAKGLKTTDGRAPQGFSVTGPADPKTRQTPAAWAKARIEGEKIVVEIPSEIAAPVRLRYAWHMNPDINTVNGLGFPLLPFETDIR